MWKVAQAEPVDQSGSLTVRVRHRLAAFVFEADRPQPAFYETAVRLQPHLQVHAVPCSRGIVKYAAAAEVSQAVGDEPPFVELHSTQRVWTVAEHQVGARVDRCVRESDYVAAVLSVLLL